MTRISQALHLGALLALGAACAAASTIRFDDAYAASANVATYYQSSLGVTIQGTYLGAIGGTGNGDPGNWGLGGTNGSAFLGCNQGSSCSPTFVFSSPTSSASLDLGERNGTSGAFTVTAYLQGTMVGTTSFTVNGSGANGGWQTASFNTSLDRIVVSHPSGNFAFGLDNVVFSAVAAVPEPSTIFLLGAGLISVGAVRLRKKQL